LICAEILGSSIYARSSSGLLALYMTCKPFTFIAGLFYYIWSLVALVQPTQTKTLLRGGFAFVTAGISPTMPLQDALVRCCSSPDPFVDTEDDEYIICFNCGEKHDSEELLSAMRVQTESRRTSRRSVTGNRYTKDVKGGSATASVPEVNDKDAQPKKVNFDIPDVLPPRDTLSRNERCADLRKFIDYLQGINMQNPLTCVMNDDVGPCDYPIARRYQRDHPGKFKDAAEILIRDADLVHKYDFIKVVRTYFCGTHDFSMSSGRKAFRVHFLKLWEESPDELHAEVWDALRKCERNIYPRGHSTPQQERPGLDRAVNSVPKEVPRASKTTTPSLDPTVEPPTRPWTAQGNLTRGSKPLRFESDVTPSKTFRGPSWSTLAIATESTRATPTLVTLGTIY
jgi:hypothetical protein